MFMSPSGIHDLPRRIGLSFVLCLIAACSSHTPFGFQSYKLGATLKSLASQMRNARQLELKELVAYAFLTADMDGLSVSRWVDRRRTVVGDSVTVISTFSGERIVRVDVVYPMLVALENECSICQALRKEYGPATSTDSSMVPVTERWENWSDREVRLSRMGPALIVTYLARKKDGRGLADPHAKANRSDRRRLQ